MTVQPRLIRPVRMAVRDGAFELAKSGAVGFEWSDPYHFALALSWPGFALLFLGLELVLNLTFALLYIAVPGAIANLADGSLRDAFFFSLETLATVGYGTMSPATTYGHIVCSAEIISGTAFTAIMTGLTFVRFSRPKAKLLYAEQAVVTLHNGAPTLMLRLANGRLSMLTDARAQLSVLLMSRSTEGRTFRLIHDLRLRRRQLPVFPLTWTIMHIIDEHSPLYGYDEARLLAEDARLYLSIQAVDRALAAEVRGLRDYGPGDIRFGHHYADAVSRDENGKTTADLSRISLVEAD